MMRDVSERLVRTWALDAAAHARALASIDPTWGSEVAPIADGQLVVSGRDMYVNRAMAVGIDRDAPAAELERIVDRSRALGVVPAVEVTPLTRPTTIERLGQRGFVRDPSADVTALVRTPGASVPAGRADVVVRPVTTDDDLAILQEVSAVGWGHVEPRARQVADAYARAAYTVAGEVLLIAADATGDRPIGCAAVTIRDGIATLGGMSTAPDHRRRGVQAELVRHRLRLAHERGCDVAATTTKVDSASQRNLVRLGFAPLFVIETWTIASSR